MTRLSAVALSLALLLVTLTPAVPTWADAPGDDLQAKVIKAYRQINDYRSTVAFEMLHREGRWVNSRKADLRVALDRNGTRLAFDKPDMRLVIDQGKLRLGSPEIQKRHLELAAPALELETITTALPFISNPMAPDLAFLTATDPIVALGGTAGGVTHVAPAEGEAQPGLTFAVEGGTMTLRVNPTTHLIETATQSVDVEAMGGNPGDTMTLTYTIDARPGKAAADDAFAFDTTDSTAVASVQELVGGDDEAPPSLEGQDAPPIELSTLDGKAFKLADAKEKVIVLDFWATWCPPCRESLPKLQSVYDWSKDQKKSVAIYAVNLQELPEQVKDYWDKSKFTMPVLMDQEGKAGAAYQVQSIPQTFIISGGKIAHVHTGYDPGMADTLKKQIDELLAE